MGRPSLAAEKKAAWTPVLARTFAELGFRRTTTAELARRLEVQENLLYRLWPDKRAMFVAAIEFVYENSATTWRQLLADAEPASHARLLLAYEARHHGEFGLYRILFAGLSEADDEVIGPAVRRTYQRFVRFLARQIDAHWSDDSRPARGRSALPSSPAHDAAERIAWAFVGLGTAANVGRELGLLGATERTALLEEVGLRLLSAGVPARNASEGRV